MSIETVHLSEEERSFAMTIDPNRFNPEGAAERAFKEAKTGDFFMKWMFKAPLKVGGPLSSKLLDVVGNLADAECNCEYVHYEICRQKRFLKKATTKKARDNAILALTRLLNIQKPAAIIAFNKAFREFKSLK